MPTTVKTTLAIIVISGLFGAVGLAQPTITQVSNAASFSLAPLPNSPITQGSFFAIFGTGLAPAVASCGAGLSDCIWKPYPLPTTIKGTSVTVTTKTSSANAYLYLVADFGSYSQINAVMPSTIPPGPAQITVTYNGQTSAPVNVTVAAASFGSFAANRGGTGPGIFFNIDSITGVGSLNTVFNTAKPGQYITMYGTGLGAPVAVATEGSAAPQLPDDFTKPPHNLGVEVWVGNKQATVAYAGRSGYSAEDQINFVVPSGVQGCFVQVAIRVTPSGGGTPIVSNFTSLAVDPNGASCQDTNGTKMSDLNSAIQSKGAANVGVVSLLSNYVNINLLGSPLPFVNDTVTADFATFSSQALKTFQGFTQTPSVNSCSVNPYRQYPPAIDPVLAGSTMLDAGSALSVQGPVSTLSVPKKNSFPEYFALGGGAAWPDFTNQAGYTQPFFLASTKNSDGTFSVTGIASGPYTVTGAAGSAVGAFTADINPTAAASFQWTNESVATNSSFTSPILRTSPLNITWTGGDPQGFIDITIIGSTTQQFQPDATVPGVIVQCVAKASDGQFNVPTHVLQALPSTAISASPIAGMIMVGPDSGAVKISPTPSGLDAAYVLYRFVQGATAIWQ